MMELYCSSSKNKIYTARKGNLMDKVKVSLIKTQDPYEGVRRAVERLGHPGLNIKNSSVLLKPNVCYPFPPEENLSNTHPDVIGGLIRYLKEEGARNIFVGDEPVYGLSSRLCYEKSGTKEIVEREGGKLVFFEEEKRIKRKIPGGRIYESISLPRILDEVDLLINAPKMKTSMMTTITLCIKNLFGLIPFRDRKRFHRGIDLSYALVDIAKIITPNLNVIDGIVATGGGTAHDGIAYPLNLLIGSADMVAADIVGTQVMGLDPMEPVTNQIALKDKLGIEDIGQIEIVGEELEKIKANFKRPIYHFVHPKSNVEVIPGGICPGCMTRIPRIPPSVDEKKRYGIIIGKRVRFPKSQEFDEI
jgi:uncharacterized protein (DUF362 family)